jgi:predicted ATPase
MISKIQIENLKSFNHIELATNNFTLLVGMNSAGKSTVIQSILLAMQNVTEECRSPLNGKLVSLGQFSDARNFINNAKVINIRLIATTDKEISFSLSSDVVLCPKINR